MVCNSLVDLGVLGGSKMESLHSERGDSVEARTGSGLSADRFGGVLGSTWSNGGLALSSGKGPIRTSSSSASTVCVILCLDRLLGRVAGLLLTSELGLGFQVSVL